MITKKECWEWIGYKVKGYGHLTFKGRNRRLNRVIGMLCLDMPDNPKIKVLHKCEFANCIKIYSKKKMILTES